MEQQQQQQQQQQRKNMEVNVIWFRHGLRLHDNPALLEALKASNNTARITLIPIFIFDGESGGTKSVGYNRMKFLLDALRDIDIQLQELQRDYDGAPEHAHIGRLLLCSGNPVAIFRCLHQYIGLHRICFEQDCEPIWHQRDNSVVQLCHELGIECVEKVSHTLWDPRQVIATNGGIPPLTYQMFLHTVQILGLPPRPVTDACWQHVDFVQFEKFLNLTELNAFTKFPTPEDFNIYPNVMGFVAKQNWVGGERQALVLLEHRLRVEEAAFQRGRYLPNQAYPNIIDSPKSMSAHLRYGCLSVRYFYWSVHDLHRRVQEAAAAIDCIDGKGKVKGQLTLPGGTHITGQLIWREYFYTMSVYNPNYDRMENNEICLTIPWAPTNEHQLELWRNGRTGFPLIDASMRQLLAEGWLHHTLRNIVATFLTRGALWQSWEHGLQHFLYHLLDADWSVCAGNWMWVSSSAFEHLLDTSLVTCPIALAKRLDPNGDYIRQYVSELAHVPREFIHEPWRMPISVQESAECVIGVHYPERMIDLTAATQRNMHAMQVLRHALMAEGDTPAPHIRPSNEQEIRHFFWLE